IRPITSPPDGELDNLGAFAPDGHALAFLRTRGRAHRLMVVRLSQSLEPAGKPMEILTPHAVTSVCWTADSRDLVFAAGGVGNQSMLWRVPASAKSPPRQISYAGNGLFPAVSRQGNRMAFVRYMAEGHIWALDLDDEGKPIGPARKVFASTRTD